jgi:cell division protein FtsW
MLIGAIFSYSLPVFLEMNKHLSEYHFFVRYIIFAAFGFALMVLLSRLDPEKWFNKIGFAILIFSGTLVLLLPFLPESIAPIINGAKRWIKLGLIKFSPVEFFKIGVIFFLAWSFTRKVKISKNLKEELKIILPYLLFLGIFWILIVFLLSDLGQVMVMVIIFALMLFVAGGRLQTFGIFFLIGIVLVTIAVYVAPYRLQRIKNWLYTFTSNFFPHPLVDGSSSSYYQVVTSLKAIHHGGITGVGIGNGIFKLGYLSDVHTDFVLAGIAEEAGFIGVSIVLFLLLLLIFRLFKVSNRSEKKEYKLFAFGIGSLIAIQLIINGLGVTSIIPIKGLTVPFLSYGGSSLVAFCVGIGMVLMISKKAKM